MPSSSTTRMRAGALTKAFSDSGCFSICRANPLSATMLRALTLGGVLPRDGRFSLDVPTEDGHTELHLRSLALGLGEAT